MNTTKRYFKETASGALAMLWFVTETAEEVSPPIEEGGAPITQEVEVIVARGFDTMHTPFELADPTDAAPAGWAEIDEAAFTSEKAAVRTAELAAMTQNNQEAADRAGILQRLANNADNLLGGLLG